MGYMGTLIESFTHIHYLLVYPDGYKKDIYSPIEEKSEEPNQNYLSKKLRKYTKTSNLIELRNSGYKLLLVGLVSKG